MIESVKKFILATNGVWPDLDTYMALYNSGTLPRVAVVSHNSKEFIASITFSYNLGNLELTREEYTTEAAKMGFINGYRWGVEYPTNGKKPDLPDDVVVYARTYGDGCGKGSFVKEFYWSDYKNFKVVDDRYKPADTSYLSVSEIPESKSNAENVSDWYDYEAQKAVALPPVGVECEYLARDEEKDKWINCFVIGFDTDGKGLVCKLKRDKGYKYIPCYSPIMRPLDHNRKAEAEKKRVVDAATEILYKHACATKGELIDGAKALYDLGYLRLPEQK